MPKKLRKSLHDYLSKIKLPALHSPTFPSPETRIFSGCKHPKTLSFAVYHKDGGPGLGHDDHHHHHHPEDAATLSDIDRFIFENFKSLYSQNYDDDVNEYDHDHHNHNHNGDNMRNSSRIQRNMKEKTGGALFGLPLDLKGSNRDFVKKGRSGSLTEDAKLSDSTYEDMTRSSSSTTASIPKSGNTLNDTRGKESESLPDECIATLTYTKDPYNGFRSSMDEMIEARLDHGAKVDWDFMEELLFCYLNMNDKKSYKDIISAFVDIVTSLGSRSDKAPGNSKLVRVAKERMKNLETVL